MKAPSQGAKKRKTAAPGVELEPDAWARFEQAVDKVLPPKGGDKSSGHRPSDEGREPKS